MSISLFLSIENQYESLRRMNTVSMMNVMSHQIEDQVINHQIPADFFAGFQRFSRFPDQLRRYGRLGAVCRRVHVLGVADCQPPTISGIEFMELAPSSQLAQEWFLLVNTADFWATLVAREMPGQDPITKSRRFDAVWSYDVEVVERIALLVSQIMEKPYQPVRDRNYTQQNFHITEMNSRMTERLEKTDLLSQRRWSCLKTLKAISALPTKNLLLFLQEASQVLLNIFGAASASITMKMSDSTYRVVVAAGEAMGEGWTLQLSEGISGQVMREQRSVRIQDTNQSQTSDALFPKARCLIATPLENRRLHGAISLGHSLPEGWNDEDLEVLEMVSRLLVVQLEQMLILAKNQTKQPNKSVAV